jgi:hypothetical protein
MEVSLLDSTRLDTTRHFTSRTTSYGDLTHVWTDDRFFVVCKEKSLLVIPNLRGLHRPLSLLPPSNYDIIAHFTHSRSTAGAERPDM